MLHIYPQEIKKFPTVLIWNTVRNIVRNTLYRFSIRIPFPLSHIVIYLFVSK